jgi:hypothetical protein
MNRKQSQNWTTMLSNWLAVFYLQAVLAVQILTMKNSATLRYSTLCFKFHYGWQHFLQAITSSVVRSGLT